MQTNCLPIKVDTHLKKTTTMGSAPGMMCTATRPLTFEQDHLYFFTVELNLFIVLKLNRFLRRSPTVENIFT